jgi:hypothetical protein
VLAEEHAYLALPLLRLDRGDAVIGLIEACGKPSTSCVPQ